MTNFNLDKILRIIAFILGAIVLFGLVYKYSSIVGFVLIALVLSYLLDPLVSYMQANGMNRTLAIIIAITSVILVIVWISTSVLPLLVNEIITLAKQLNLTTITKISRQVEEKILELIPLLPEGFVASFIQNIAGALVEFTGLQNTLNQLFNIFANFFYAVIIIPFTVFFFLKEGVRFRRTLLQITPNPYFETTLSIIDKIETRLGIYLKSVGLQCIIVGTSAWIFLAFFGLKNALAVGVVIGIANTIPYFGPILGYILAVIVSIFETGDFTGVGSSLLAVLLTQLLDNIILQPLIFSKSADMHPLIILLVVLIGAETAGVLGMLLAIPLATIVRITIKEIFWSYNNYHVFHANRSLR